MDLHTPKDLRHQMALRREVVLHFRTSTDHPIAPRASWPWIAIPQDDRSVLYVDKEREQVALAQLEARQPKVYPFHQSVITPWGEVVTRVSWWTPTPNGWSQVM